MVLKTLDDTGKVRSFEVEALIDEDEGLWNLCVPFITETHKVQKAWLETAVKQLGVRVAGGELRLGTRVGMNKEKLYRFYKEYEC